MNFKSLPGTVIRRNDGAFQTLVVSVSKYNLVKSPSVCEGSEIVNVGLKTNTHTHTHRERERERETHTLAYI